MMADSDKNNTRHGGALSRRGGDGDSALSSSTTTLLSESSSHCEKLKHSDDGPVRRGEAGGRTRSLLHSPTTQESGYNTTEDSPATTSSSHGTPGLHFDFEDVPPTTTAAGNEERFAHHHQHPTRLKPNLTLDIVPGVGAADDTDHSDASETPSSRGSHRLPVGAVTSEVIAQYLDLSASSRSMSRSFQDLRVHGVGDSEDDDQEGDAEKDDDELTSSEERYLRESHWGGSSRRCSLRRRNFDLDPYQQATYPSDVNFDEGSTVFPVPTGLNFPHTDSRSRLHEPQSTPDSPTASNPFSRYLENDIPSSSIGIVADSPSPTAEAKEEEKNTSPTAAGVSAQQSRRRRPREVEHVFRLSLSSDEGNYEDSLVNENTDDVTIANEGVDDDDSVFTFDIDDNYNTTATTLANASDGCRPGYSSSSYSPPSNPHASVARLRHSTHSSPSIVTDKPPISPSYLLSSARGARRRHQLSSSVSVRLQLSGGASIQHVEMSGQFSVATQTPHRTSRMIQDVMSTPLPVPNEARGTAVSRLRRLSESGGPLPPSPAPLPDIIPFVRGRASSVPDTQAYARRRALQTGRLVGRELRRMSDEFNSSWRFSSPPNTDVHEYASSFPGVRPLLSLMRGAWRSRRGSSVDDDENGDHGNKGVTQGDSLKE